MLGGLVTAIRTLTILPVPGPEAEEPASALAWFPVVGGALGFVLYGLCLLADRVGLGSWPEGTAFVVVFAGSFLTRALHLDGLADSADGFAAMKDREQTLRIMKDPRVGTFGVLALVAVLSAKWIAVTRLVETGTALWLVAACVVSRAVQVELAVTLPYSRAEGGTAARFVTGARPVHRLAAWSTALLLLAAVTGPLGLASLVAGFAAAKVLGRWFTRRVGGVTGDLLGASSEIIETALLFAFATAGNLLSPLAGWSTIL
ncbi:MAG: adenosylcobinamide-GDP ribazoletransferase [Deltaproteobacteria bacterium]|nr:adenosylcobinamide-GDP ribazoletransferase [Deltaproteobacteria bacterium]